MVYYNLQGALHCVHLVFYNLGSSGMWFPRCMTTHDRPYDVIMWCITAQGGINWVPMMYVFDNTYWAIHGVPVVQNNTGRRLHGVSMVYGISLHDVSVVYNHPRLVYVTCCSDGVYNHPWWVLVIHEVLAVYKNRGWGYIVFPRCMSTITGHCTVYCMYKHPGWRNHITPTLGGYAPKKPYVMPILSCHTP